MCISVSTLSGTLPELVEHGQGAGGAEGRDFVGQILADAGDVGEFAGGSAKIACICLGKSRIVRAPLR